MVLSSPQHNNRKMSSFKMMKAGLDCGGGGGLQGGVSRVKESGRSLFDH